MYTSADTAFPQRLYPTLTSTPTRATQRLPPAPLLLLDTPMSTPAPSLLSTASSLPAGESGLSRLSRLDAEIASLKGSLQSALSWPI